MTRPRPLRVAGLIAASLCLVGSLMEETRAATYTWSGTGGDDSWENVGNWDGVSVPGLGDTAEFGSVTPQDSSVIAAPISLGSVAYTTPGYALSIQAATTIANGISASPGNAPDLEVGSTLAIGGSATVGRLTGSGQVDLGAQTLTVSSGTFDGEISGTGGSLVKSGAGTLTLEGINEYTGSTTVEAGTLRVDGEITSDVTVQDGATFGGEGLVLGSIVLESGALLVPVGCFDANTLTWEEGATMLYDIIDDPGILELTGALTKSGDGPFQFTFLNGEYVVGQQLLLISFASTDFEASDFSYTNGGGFTGVFAIDAENDALRFTVTNVPEPSTYAMVLIALAAAFIASRRRSRARA